MDGRSRSRKYHFGLVHAFYATMGGFVLDTSCEDETVGDKSSSEPSASDFHVPKPMAFIYIMKYFPEIIPDISEESITDRVESNSLSKALLIVQIGWFCTNCAARLIHRLPLSLLEVSTAAHGFCTLLTYFIWWSKPLNIAVGTTMRGKEVREVHALLICSENEYNEAKRMAAGESPTAANSNKERIVLAANALKHLPNPQRFPERPFHNHFGVSSPGSSLIFSLPHHVYTFIPMAIPTILYGLIHFLAWSDHFPTPREHLLWRVSSVVVTCSGPVFALMAWISNNFYKYGTEVLIALLMGLVIPLTYVLASGFLVVESFRQLFFLDPTVYQLPSWSNYWPHLS